MHSPVVAAAPRFFEASGINEHDAALRHRTGRRGNGQQFDQQPQQPVACVSQTFLPGYMRQVRQANEHRPCSQLTQGGGTQDIGQQTS